jgi:hypothetical protein
MNRRSTQIQTLLFGCKLDFSFTPIEIDEGRIKGASLKKSLLNPPGFDFGFVFEQLLGQRTFTMR